MKDLWNISDHCGIKTSIHTGHYNKEITMVQRLHLVFGGELKDPSSNAFRNVDDIDIVGIFPSYAAAFDAWKSKSQQTVDNAHARYFIAHLHRLRDEEVPHSATEELG
jgi:hypothetical protein